ncbi:MAG: PQQ-binding-like beta-propeller repeat protein [Planctomycetaceae bacterium]|nr:PQQ-binding-like beta-propeller repeat protein [Planctomycetales bacterium]MCB9923301.1 PQQ-binding-like beta-propeller repeat protein [Planctomycetaceae bacterium]
MPRSATCIVAAMSVVFLCGADWLQFRGVNGASVSPDVAPPDSWSETSNIAWKADLPGRGASGPIVVDGRTYVTCSSGVKQDRLHVLCFDNARGERLWHREFWATGRTLTHPFSAVAAPTPASDGERIFAFYSSNDLACLDLDGNLLWYRGLAFDYPKAGNDIGMASSPVVVGETVVVQVENQGDSFAAGVDVATGETRWRIERERRANWVSPIALPGNRDGGRVVLLQSASGLTAHDSLTGEELWRYEVPCSTTPSVAVNEDHIFIPANGLTVLKLAPDATVPSLAWDSSQLSPSPASPIVVGDRVYTMNSSGVLACGDVATGKRLWQLRVGGKFWSTPVVARDRMYCINSDGAAKVIQLGEKGEVIGSNEFSEEIKGSPAISGGALYVRSDHFLWKIASGS